MGGVVMRIVWWWWRRWMLISDQNRESNEILLKHVLLYDIYWA